MDNYQFVSNWSIISHFLILHGLSPYWENSLVPGGWSVSVEVLFYIICPFIFVKITSINKAIYLYFLTFFIGQIMYWFLFFYPLIPYEETWIQYIYTYFPTQLPVFILGLVAYKIIINKGFQSFYQLLSLLIPLLLLSIFQWYLTHHNSIINLSMLNNMLFGLMFMFLILFLNKYNVKMISNVLASFYGKISYSVYLCHFAILHLIEHSALIHMVSNNSLNYILRYLLVLFFTTFISVIFYNVIELPFQKLGKRLINKSEKANLRVIYSR